jgi:alpha-1,2-mannosyltransferase
MARGEASAAPGTGTAGSGAMFGHKRAMVGPSFLRDAGWLSDDRARAVRNLLLVLLPATALVWLILSHGAVDPGGKPLGTDYLSFWSAARLALAGHPAAPYDVAVHHAAQRAAMGGAEVGYAAFFYPPVFLMALLPFGVLPYLASLTAWLLSTFYACWRAIRPWLRREASGRLAFFAYPALIVNAAHGQNGFLSAALLGGGAFLLETRPWLAGALLGALVIKPHLALLVPLALLLRGLWRPLVAAAASATLLVGLSAALLGLGAWRAFLAGAPLARATLEQGLVDPAKMQSLFAAVRLLGGGVTLAYTLQAAIALAAAAGLVLAARARTAGPAQGALLIAGTLLATPFLLDYDLTLAAFPLAWLFVEARRTGFRSYEKFVLGAVFILPLVSRAIAAGAGIPLAPLLLTALFALVLRRAAAPEPGGIVQARSG